MKKRNFLRAVGLAAAGSCVPLLTSAQALSTTVAAAWRQDGSGTAPPGDYVGLLQMDWQAAQTQVVSSTATPSRAHGIQALADGGFVAVATRPGRWIVRCDVQGRAVQWLNMDRESEDRTLDGHVCASSDGQWLYTAETNPKTSQGWISVRDVRTLRKMAQWRTYGVEPHQIILDSTGALMIANGGILRVEGDKKRDLQLMDSSLVRLDPRTGERLGQWRLKDQRLGIRHMAWSQSPTKPLLGIALQNEHDDLALRRSSPVFAVWDGDTLKTPAQSTAAGGYAGDITAGPDGGFVVSCLRTHMVLCWNPATPESMPSVLQLENVGALATGSITQPSMGVLLGSSRGVGRWHPTLTPVFLKWPVGMAPDNHWVLV
jgi:hypothetical protein